MAVISTAPFLLLAVAYGKAEGLIWLMFPVVLFVPALLASVLIFAPVEFAAVKLGFDPNVLLPISGALLGALVVFISLKTSKNPHVVGKLLSGDPSTLGSAVGIVLAGAAIGGVWRLSLWALKSLNWA